MHYGVPQLGRCYKTKRVKIMTMYADTFAEEKFLTILEEGFREGNIEHFSLKMNDGREIFFTFPDKEEEV